MGSNKRFTQKYKSNIVRLSNTFIENKDEKQSQQTDLPCGLPSPRQFLPMELCSSLIYHVARVD